MKFYLPLILAILYVPLLTIRTSTERLHPILKNLDAKDKIAKHYHLVQVFNLYCKLQRKTYKSFKELNYRMRIFKQNLQMFIRPEDDVLDRIKIEQVKGTTPRIIILPDQRLSVDFSDEVEESLRPSFELNKFSDLTNKEFDNLFLLDQDYFDEEKYPIHLEDGAEEEVEGIESIKASILGLEKVGIKIDKEVKDRYFTLPEQSTQSTRKSGGLHYTPHFSTKPNKKNEAFFSESDPEQSPPLTHKNFTSHPRLLGEFSFLPKYIPRNQYVISIDGVMIPTFVDWRQMGGQTPIKDQIKCNACYAFSAMAAIESHFKIKTGKTVSLSEQEIVDCSRENRGCVGGLPHLVFNYVRSNDIAYTQSYPYDEQRDSPCRIPFNASRFGGHHVRGFINIQRGMLNLIKALSKGPVATISYASAFFKMYRGGLYGGEGCSRKDKPNHSSLLIGYNLTGDQKFLIFKNGWGTDWGDSGYYYVKINNLNPRSQGHCMIAATKYNSLPRL